jgi:hypothetical protein
MSHCPTCKRSIKAKDFSRRDAAMAIAKIMDWDRATMSRLWQGNLKAEHMVELLEVLRKK